MDSTTTENPAAAAARMEYQALMTDSAHPLHAAWKSGDAAAVDRHLAPFYQKVAGATPHDAQRLTSEGGSTAARETLRREMQEIFTNPKHPLHAGYLRGDPDVLKQIDEKYAKVYKADATTQAGSPSEQPAQTDADIEQAEFVALRHLWDQEGTPYDVAREETEEFGRTVTDNRPDYVRQIYNEAVRCLGRPVAMWLLHDLKQQLMR